jgi:hypothetical protein
MTDSNPTTCDDFLALLNAVLDGDVPRAAAMAHPHYTACSDCRSLVAAAEALVTCRAPVPPLVPHFTDNVLGAVHSSRLIEVRRKQLLGVCGLITLAAAVMLALWLNAPAHTPPTVPAFVATTTPTVTASVNDAKKAMASLTTSVAQETLAPARNLFTLSSDKTVPETAEAPALAALPSAATAGLQPIASTTRRAFDALVRDVSSFASAGQ